MRKSNPFVMSSEGLNIYRMQKHEGYKLSDSLGNLTPLQELFLIFASNYENEQQERQSQYGQERLEMDNEIQEKLRQRGFK